MPHNWVLEDRICLCGCGKPFRVLPTSTARYASFWHENGIEAWYEIQGERKVKAGMAAYYEEAKSAEDLLVQIENGGVWSKATRNKIEDAIDSALDVTCD